MNSNSKQQYTPQQIEEENIKRAKMLYQTRPFVTKTFMVLHYKFEMEFLRKHWEKITSN